MMHLWTFIPRLAMLALIIHATNSMAQILPVPEQIAEGGGSLFGGGSMKLWEVEKIAEDIYGFRYSFYRSLFIVTEEGVIATDPLNTEAGPVLREQIRKITDQPVRFVSYSHSHWDHISGGQVFKDEGATFVAQERCAENFREMPNPDIVMPDVTYRDHYTIMLGGKSLDMHYYGPSHDNCMVVMHIRPINLLYVVDVANPPTGWTMFYNPAVSEDRVWNIVQFLDGVANLIEQEGIDTVIGGHMSAAMTPQGRPTVIRGTIGSSASVAERRDFWQAVMDATRSELAANTPADEIADKLIAEGFLADKVIAYDANKMRILIRRMISFAKTGE